jgi:hypothetical protein
MGQSLRLWSTFLLPLTFERVNNNKKLLILLMVGFERRHDIQANDIQANDTRQKSATEFHS